MGYLACLGPPASIDRVLAGQGLAQRLETEGLRPAAREPSLALFLAPALPAVSLPPGRGLILGSLFTREREPRPVRAIRPAAADGIVAGEGQALIRSWWGRYIAFLLDGPDILAVRDPSGAIPAQHAVFEDIRLVFDEVGVPLRLGLVDPAPDPGFARHWLAYPHLRTARTGLAAVRELLPGTGLSVTGAGAEVRRLWNPWDFASADRQLTDFGDAAAALRAEALRTIPRQAAGPGQGLLELSGGLDSSIVAAALSHGGVTFSAITFATRSPDGDERRHARAVAEAFSIPLEEAGEEEPADILSGPGPHDPLRPGRSPVLRPMERAFRDHALGIGADALLTGAGGDNLFCYLTTAAPALDAARLRGLQAGARALADVAELCGCTWWTALRFALRKAAYRRPPSWKSDRLFLAQGSPFPPDVHPWLEAPPGALSGKREHVQSLVRIHHFLEGGGLAPPLAVRHPLLAQPLLELCLAIPTWMWVRGGCNRAVARAAFEPILPASIIQRRTKGRLESLCSRAFARNRPAIGDLLARGRLAGEGLMDGPAVEAWLAGEGEPDDARYFRILDFVTLELWLRASREAARSLSAAQRPYCPALAGSGST